MEAIVNVVIPVFLIVLSGYLAARFRILGSESTDALNRFVFFVAMPVLLFHAVAGMEPAEFFNGPFIVAFSGSSIVIMGAAMVVSRLVFRRPLPENTLAGMSSVFGNTVYMGIPISLIAFGDAALKPAIVASISQGVILIVPVIVFIEWGVQEEEAGGRILRDLLATLVRNPLIVAPALGLAWAFTGVPLPEPVGNFCDVLGAAAGPCALFALGLFLYGKPLHEGAAEVGAVVVLKLLLLPATAWLFLYHLFDIDPLWAKVGVLLAALPTGANCFVLAQQYGRFVQRTSAAILISTALAVITVSVLFMLPLMTSPG